LRTMSSAERIIAGSDYVAALSARASDRRYRAHFQQVTLSLVPQGGALFDFGSGPGIDARYYAEHGRKVSGYDVDPLMCAHFAAHCADLIAGGAITLHRGAYPQFLTSVVAGCEFPVQLVTSNFAPLNLIDDLRQLFALFDELTVPGGAVLASVLNPYFVGDLRYRWWWRNVARLLRTGRYAVPGAQALIWRRRLTDFAAQSAPHFVLERVFPGNTHSLRFPGPALPLRLSTCRFMFLLFRKTR
jgi:SAM-dependent methyltransferase